MFYFFHGTSMEAFENILKEKYMYSSKYLNKVAPKYVRTNIDIDYVFTNIYTNDIPLKEDEKSGFGPITLIIDPIILKYKKCYLNEYWVGDINSRTIIMNNNIPLVLNKVKELYRYPLVTTHEALFKNRISMRYVTGVIYEKNDKNKIRKLLDKYGYQRIKIFKEFPKERPEY